MYRSRTVNAVVKVLLGEGLEIRSRLRPPGRDGWLPLGASVCLEESHSPGCWQVRLTHTGHGSPHNRSFAKFELRLRSNEAAVNPTTGSDFLRFPAALIALNSASPTM